MSVFNKKRTVNGFEVDPEDAMFLRPEEHTFLFFGASHQVVRMLSGKKENYTAGTINFREVSLRPVDLVGKRCSHSKQVVNEIHTACVGIHQNHVKFLFQESEFPKWFAAQDKEKLTPYRFVRPRKRTLVVEGSSFQLQINNGEKVDEYTFEGLTEIPYSSVAALATETRIEPASPAGGLGSLVSTPPMASMAGEGAEVSAEGIDSGWRGGGGVPTPGMSASSGAGMSHSAGMSGYGAAATAPSAGAGMTMAGEAAIPSGAGGVSMGTGAASPGGSSPSTQTVVVCPHCTQPILFAFQASRFGQSE